jgi:hypothetical protein
MSVWDRFRSSNQACANDRHRRIVAIGEREFLAASHPTPIQTGTRPSTQPN